MKTTFLAGVLDDASIPGFGPMGSVAKERVIVFGTLLLVIAAVLVWAYLSRRKRRQRARREERRHRRHSFAENATKGIAEIKQLVEEKQRGRRRHHRPRNPTLAETGGLPPVRKDDPPPATPPP